MFGLIAWSMLDCAWSTYDRILTASAGTAACVAGCFSIVECGSHLKMPVFYCISDDAKH
jgi:hypothetical protein